MRRGCQYPHAQYLTHRRQMQGLREAALARWRKCSSDHFHGERRSQETVKVSAKQHLRVGASVAQTTLW
ncbi:MAG: hypothetical protein HY584_00380 [Candidatus Omnitrophica bacterium]|nr:hypothetical protein [Candidatus Omnitrophota bacterium]